MARTVTFKFEPGDEAFYPGLEGIYRTIIHNVSYTTKTGNIMCQIAGGLTTMNENLLYRSVEELKEKIILIGDN